MKHEKDVPVSATALFALLRGDLPNAIRDCDVGMSEANISSQLRGSLVLMRGCTYAMQRDFENAKQDFSTWIARDESDSSLGYNLRADIYENLGDWENALADLNQAILRTESHSSEAAALLFRRATIWAELGEPDMAIKDYEAVANLNPEHPTAVLHLLLLVEGSASALETAALLREKERDVSVGVSEPEPTLDTALDQLVAGDLEGALEICEWLSENRPDEVNTVFVSGLAKDLQGRRFSEAGNTAEAENDYHAAIRDYADFLDNPSSEDSEFRTLASDRRGQLQLAIAQEAIGDRRRQLLAGAIADFSHVIARDPQNPLVYLHRGQSYLARYDYEEASQDFNRVFDCNPDPDIMSLAYELNGTVFLLNLHHAEAVELFKEARDYAEDSPTEKRLMLSQAVGEYLQKNYETALALLREIESSGVPTTLQGRARYAFERKLELLEKKLREVEGPGDRFPSRFKAECDAILKRLNELFSPKEPVMGLA